jgi:hypothetical protein
MREYGISGYFRIQAAPTSRRDDAHPLSDREMLERIDGTVRELRSLILALSPPPKRA